MDDEAFMVWLSSAAHEGPGSKIFNEKTALIFEKKPAFRKNVFSEVKQQLRLIPSFDGGLSAEFVDFLSFPVQRINPYIVKLVKGLLRALRPDYDYSMDVFLSTAVTPLDWSKIPLIRQVQEIGRHDSRGDGVFDVWHCIVSDKDAGFWLLQFYSAAWILVGHAHGERAEKLLKTSGMAGETVS